MKDNKLVCVAREVSFLFSKSTLILADGLADAEILIPIYGSRWKHKHFAPLRVVFAIPSATQPLLFALSGLVFCLDCGDVWVIVTTNTAQRLRSSLGHTHTHTHTHTTPPCVSHVLAVSHCAGHGFVSCRFYLYQCCDRKNVIKSI